MNKVLSQASDETSFDNDHLIDVILPLPIPRALTYILPKEIPFPFRSSRVLVPVGSRNMVGLAWGTPAEAPVSVNLKRVKKILDQEPLLPESLISFLEWTSSYYFYPLGQVMAEALPPGILSARNRRISQINSIPKRQRACRLELQSWSSDVRFELTAEQTEVYLRTCEECVRHGRSVLILVPEIAMTTQAVGWFVGRFGEDVTVLHSGLTEPQRRDQWWKIRRGESRIVVGTRSAVFAPLNDIGLIVVDEEHDSSYKQSEKLRYQARDLALLRGRMSDATVILGSATPSVASYNGALVGRYELINMGARVAGRALPHVSVVDRRGKEKKDRRRRKSTGPEWLSGELGRAIKDNLDRKEQVLLFLNRRGFATYVFCPDCGHVFRCPHCEVTLTWHRGDRRTKSRTDGVLRCHYWGMESAALPVCPECTGQAVKALGYGTERVVSDIEEIFPGAGIARLDRDTVQGRKRMEEVIRSFRAGHVDILVGTQMITKGHDFPGLTLVGVLCADLSLNFPEYHAAERTFQLLAQVAGRSGRGELPGRVLIQTLLPDHYVLDCATTHDFKTFYEKESGFRKALGYPPFGRLINLRFSGRKKASVCDAAGNMARLARRLAKGVGKSGEYRVEVLGPAPAPRVKLRDRYRWQILLKSSSLSNLRAVCHGLISKKEDILSFSVRMDVDVDPYSLL